MSEYEIPDPWQSRVRYWIVRLAVCSWRGHERPVAFGGGTKPCRRCDR